MGNNYFIENSASVEAETYLIIKVENELIDKIKLTEEKRTEITTKGKIGNSIVEINGKKVRMVESACHNKTCVHTGWIEQPGELIVCLPNRVTLEIKGDKENNVDGLSY